MCDPIRADKLSGVLLHLQSLVKHAYAKSTSSLGQRKRKTIGRDEAPLFNVAVPAMAGSFRMILVAAQAPDLLGSGEIERALVIVDEIASAAGSPDETLSRVKKYRGHTASAYVRLLRFIIEIGVSIRYAWACAGSGGRL